MGFLLPRRFLFFSPIVNGCVSLGADLFGTFALNSPKRTITWEWQGGTPIEAWANTLVGGGGRYISEAATPHQVWQAMESQTDEPIMNS